MSTNPKDLVSPPQLGLEPNTSGLNKREFFSTMVLSGILANSRYHHDMREAVRQTKRAVDLLIQSLNEEPSND